MIRTPLIKGGSRSDPHLPYQGGIKGGSAPPLSRLSISQIFLNKKRRNLKKGETIDRYSFERRN
ncbi:MAG: hypothetical protein EWV60_02765 [Microcystis sp. Msp_OC_L_20101000_S702]|nr:MAG: hypothetical protein EWV60_02765 [Microcystis sp. Msp_OC_L_20101000_S702]